MSLSLIDCEDKIGWNPSYTIELHEEKEEVYLFSEQMKMGLQGKVYFLLAPLLVQGIYSADELADQLSEQASLEMVYFALQKLDAKHLILPVSNSLSKPLAAFCGLLNIDGKTAMQRLEATKIYIQDPSGEVEPLLKEVLHPLQMHLVNTLQEADIVLVIVKDYLEPTILEHDGAHPTWILLKPFGSTLWLGPILGKDHPLCYACLSQRIKQNRFEETIKGQAPMITLEATKQMALDLTAIELLKWIIAGKNERLEGKILTLDTLDLKLESHVVPNSAHCPHRSKEAEETSAEVRLKPRKKTNDYRSMTPEETLEKYAHHVSDITGLIKQLQPVKEQSGSSIHVYKSGANLAVNNASPQGRISNFRSICSGKGTTDLIAKVGCLCESIERLSGVFCGDEKKTYATYSELAANAIYPEKLALFSPEQYQNRESINASAHRFSKIGTALPEDALIAWTQVWSLTENRIKFVPTSYCYFNYQPEKEEWIYHADSNGCAAGNCLEEAILQGFFELVERDSIAIWWYNRIRYPQIDLDSFKIPYIQTLIEDYALCNREIHVLDITSDLGIPTCVAISRLKEGPQEKIYFGFGCHLDSEVALLRALTEMNQFFAQGSFWDEEEIFENPQDKKDRQVVREWMRQATFENQPYLLGEGVRSASDYQKWKSSDLLEDIAECRKIVEAEGFEFLVLDQTRKEIGLNVVRVIVPGLRHFWARFAPGRLYEVPVKMGKIKSSLNESELNPIPMFV